VGLAQKNRNLAAGEAARPPTAWESTQKNWIKNGVPTRDGSLGRAIFNVAVPSPGVVPESCSAGKTVAWERSISTGTPLITCPGCAALDPIGTTVEPPSPWPTPTFQSVLPIFSGALEIMTGMKPPVPGEPEPNWFLPNGTDSLRRRGRSKGKLALATRGSVRACARKSTTSRSWAGVSRGLKRTNGAAAGLLY